MKRFQQVLTFLSTVLLFALSGPAAAQTYKLGAVLSLTGGASFIGEDLRSSLEESASPLHVAASQPEEEEAPASG